MQAPLSIVIPTLNAADRVGPCLASIWPAFTGSLACEVIFADGGSTDDIAAVARETGARMVTAPPGRGGQLRAGAEAAKGDWLLFLHADTVLSEGWEDAARAHIAQHPGKAGWFRLRFEATGFAPAWVAGWANARSLIFALPYGDQGLLVSRKLYEETGGFPNIPLMEDVALARRLGRRRLRGLNATALTSAEKYEQGGWFRRGLRNFRCLGLYLTGTTPEKIMGIYRK